MPMDYTTGMNTSSAIINSQLVPQVRSAYIYPFAVGPIIQGVPASPPQSAPGFSGGSSGSSDAGSLQAHYRQMAASNPWHPKWSPVPWLIGMFIVGYLMIRYIHWGYTVGTTDVIVKAPVKETAR